MAFVGVAVAFSQGFLQSSPVAGQWRGDALGLAAGIFRGLTTLTIRSTVLSHALGMLTGSGGSASDGHAADLTAGQLPSRVSVQIVDCQRGQCPASYGCS